MGRWITIGLGTAVGSGLAFAAGALAMVIIAARGEGTGGLVALWAAMIVAFAWTGYCVLQEWRDRNGRT